MKKESLYIYGTCLGFLIINIIIQYFIWMYVPAQASDKSYKVTAYMMEPHRSMHQWMHVTNVKVDANGVLYFTHYGKRVVLKNDNFLVEDDYRGEE